MKTKFISLITLLLSVLILGGCTINVDMNNAEKEVLKDTAETVTVNINDTNDDIESTDSTKETKNDTFEKADPPKIIEVSSNNYGLEIPLFDGFEFSKLRSNFEFLLKHKEYNLIFYFESDYSPNLMGMKSKKTTITNKEGYKFNITTYDTGDGNYVAYVESADDNKFYFSIVYSEDNLSRNTALIQKVITDLNFNLRPDAFKPYDKPEAQVIPSKQLLSNVTSSDLNFIENVDVYNKPSFDLINEGPFKSSADKYFEENVDDFMKINFEGSFKVSQYSYLLSWGKDGANYKYIVSQGCMPHACGDQWGTMISSYNNTYDNYAVFGDTEQYNVYQFNREIPEDLLKILSFVHIERPRGTNVFTAQ